MRHDAKETPATTDTEFIQEPYSPMEPSTWLSCARMFFIGSAIGLVTWLISNL